MTKNAPKIPDYLSSIMDNLNVPAFLKDASGIYQYCNTAFALLLGLPQAHIIGKTVHDIANYELTNIYHHKASTLLDHQSNQEYCTKVIHKNGQSMTVTFHKTIIKDTDGNVVGTLGIITDPVQKELFDESIRRYNIILNYSKDIILFVNPDTGQIIEANAAAEQTYGYTYKELLKMTIYDLRSDLSEVKNQLKQAQSGGLLFETHHKRKDGSIFPVQVNSAGAKFGSRNILISIVRDITEGNKLKNELHNQNKHLTYLHEISLELMNRRDTTSLLLEIILRAKKLANTEHAFIYTIEPNEPYIIMRAGTGICEKLVGMKLAVGEGISGKVWREGQPLLIENYSTWPERLCGSIYDNIHSTLGVPLKLDKNVIGIIGLISLDEKVNFSNNEINMLNSFAELAALAIDNARLYNSLQKDIANRHIIEHQLQIKNSELQNTLDQLRKLQMGLVQQEKLAAIGQLAAGVAHEINNPLGYVISNCNTLKKYVDKIKIVLTEYQKADRLLNAQQDTLIRNWLLDVKKCSRDNNLDFILADLDGLLADSLEGLDRIARIVANLKTFSRIDQPNQLEQYSVNAGIDSTLLIAWNEIKYSAEVRKNYGSLPYIPAIGSQINQVFLNIIINALQAIKTKYSAGALGLITITTTHEDDYVACIFEDNGGGIPEEILPKIFDPFFTTKPIGQGTGLGLSISYDIVVNKHKGTIAAESVLGQGAKFIIRLPVN